MVHCEGADSDEPEQLLRKHLLHTCHLSLHVQGLTTGYSKDVHGNVRLIVAGSFSVLHAQIRLKNRRVWEQGY
jgi:hypothetical protein